MKRDLYMSLQDLFNILDLNIKAVSNVYPLRKPQLDIDENLNLVTWRFYRLNLTDIFIV